MPGCGAVALMLVGLLAMCAIPRPASAAEPVRIGIQAVRSKSQTLQHWQPLVAALKQAIPERDFIVTPLTNEEMESAAAGRQLDFVFTNPGNYVVIAKRSGLSSPLATLAEEEGGQAVTVFGGIIFCRSGQEKIKVLADLAGKTIAATSIEALGSYRMQAYELGRAGIQLPRDATVLFAGPSQDSVVEAVLSGRADAGFVRTGLLESMAREGKLDMATLKVINLQNPAGYPLPVSTRLYPNWPFAAMPGIDESLARRVAVALFRLEDNPAATTAMRIRGFVVPADYKPVEEMLEALRLPPFDEAPVFTLHDVWSQYRREISAALIAIGLILLLGYRLSVLNYRLRNEQRTVLQQQEQLRRSERSLSEAQRIAQMGNWNLDLESNALTWSDEIFRIFEIDPNRFGASYEAFLNAIHPDDRDLVNQAYTESVKSGMPYDIVHRLQMPDGRVKYVNERCETEYGADGRPLRSIGTVHDITELKQAEEKIRELNQKLEQRVAERTAELEASNREMKAFAYSISHDLRAPLRHIDGYVGLLVSRCRDGLSEQGLHYLDTIAAAARQMGMLIDDLLQLSHTGRTELKRERVDMNQVLQEALVPIRESSAERRIEWVIGDLPVVRGDHALLRRVWTNLLENAVKFTGQREAARIEVSAREENGEAVFVVADNGVGFDMKYVGKLFGVFQRLHPQEEFEGTGIGLATVQRIVIRHGGRVWAEAGVNQGASFHFTLPSVEENNHV
jgi:PAS domain S-box-containing protein